MARLTARGSLAAGARHARGDERQRHLRIGGTGKTGRRDVQRFQAAGRPAWIGTLRRPALRLDRSRHLAGRPRASARCMSATTPTWPSPAPPRRRQLRPGAVERGVRRQVLLSGRGEEGALRGEQAFAAVRGGLDDRAVGLHGPELQRARPQEPLRAGEVAFPAGETLAEPFIDAEDIADVAVAALTETGTRASSTR